MAVALAVGLGGWWLRSSLAPVGGGSWRLIEVPSGVGSAGVASLLKQEGLIRSEPAFRFALRHWGVAGQLKAGHYRLAPTMSSEEIARCLAEGRVALAKVTIPEGYTVAQVAASVEKAGLCSGAEFLAAARPDQAPVGELHLTGDSLEGYLFPDTYSFEYGTPPVELVRRMTGNFAHRVLEGLQTDFRKRPAPGYSWPEIVTIASMIEREAEVEKDRPLIASVIYNRLRKGMKLQIDATVIYALGGGHPRLTRRDLKVDSPFNTYRCAGLPPHAIANPGLPSLYAALHPGQTEYLFYVARRDGSHLFTKTYEEHVQAIKKVRGNG